MSKEGVKTEDKAKLVFENLQQLTFEQLTTSALAPFQAIANQKAKNVEPAMILSILSRVTQLASATSDFDSEIKKNLESLMQIAMQCVFSNNIGSFLDPFRSMMKELQRKHLDDSSGTTTEIYNQLLKIQKDLDLFYPPPQVIPDAPPLPLPTIDSASKCRPVKNPLDRQEMNRDELIKKMREISQSLGDETAEKNTDVLAQRRGLFATLTFKRDLSLCLMQRERQRERKKPQPKKLEDVLLAKLNAQRQGESEAYRKELALADTAEQVIKKFGRIVL